MSPRPRFDRLEPEKQKEILDAASHEFAEHGFEKASFNRIIESAGFSKGAMYYYFDDKKDLYLTVVRTYQRQILAQLGDLPEVSTPEEYWAAMSDLFSHAANVKMEHPEFIHLGMSMLKSMLSGELNVPSHELFRELTDWVEGLITVGQVAGAVRTDLPTGLLVALIFGALEAADMWLVQQVEELDDVDMEGAHAFSIGLFKRILEPGGDTEGRGWNMLKTKGAE